LRMQTVVQVVGKHAQNHCHAGRRVPLITKAHLLRTSFQSIPFLAEAPIGM